MKKVIIFGARGYGENVMYSLDDKLYEIVAITDNNPRIVELQMMHGVKIITPSEIKNEIFDYVIIAYSMHEVEIRKQLTDEFKIDSKKIVVYKKEFEDVKWLDIRVATLRKCLEILKERRIKGSMAELGVYQGDFAQYINRYAPEDCKLYLFDTFEGFAERDLSEIKSEQFKDTSVDIVMKKMNRPDNCVVRKGYFPESAEGIEEKFSFVSLDADLYTPILNGLKYFWPRLLNGGYIFVHDFDNTEWIGCKQAVLEFCEENNISFVPLLDKCSSVIITK